MTAPIHAYIGDPPNTIGFGSTTSAHICNCACQTCMSGGCCQLQPMQPYVGTSTTTELNTWAAPLAPLETCAFAKHDFQAITEWKLYCRKCGSVRNI